MQELDKDHSPVSLHFVPSGSEVSIIESLCREDVQPKGTSGPWTQAGDGLVSQSVSLSSIGIEEGQGTSRERVVSLEGSEGVAVEGVAAEKPHNTEQSAAHAQCNSHEGNDLHLSSALTTIPVPSLKVEMLATIPSNPRTNAHSHDHGENKLCCLLSRHDVMWVLHISVFSSLFPLLAQMSLGFFLILRATYTILNLVASSDSSSNNRHIH